MDAFDLALANAYTRMAAQLRDDPAEARRRASRFLLTVGRPIRAWSLCLRASDTRITESTAIIHDRTAAASGRPHAITLTGETIRMMCAPVLIDWPGIDAGKAAALLGQSRRTIAGWIKRGLFEVRHRRSKSVGKRGSPVPFIWSARKINPNMKSGRAPDLIWGSLWEYMHEQIPLDLRLTLIRVPCWQYRWRRGDHPQLDMPERRLLGWSFLCPRCAVIGNDLMPLWDPVPDADAEPVVFPRSAEAHERPCGGVLPGIDQTYRHFGHAEGAGEDGRAEETSKGRSTALYIPLRPWTIGDALGAPNPLESLTAGRVAQPLCGESGGGGAAPAGDGAGGEGAGGGGAAAMEGGAVPRSTISAGDVACHTCHRFNYALPYHAEGWNALIFNLTGGILRGREVARPAGMNRSPQRRVDRPARRAPVRDRVEQLLLRGVPGPAVAQRLGMQRGTVNAHARMIYKKHGVKNRGELLEKFGVPVPRRRAERIVPLLRTGMTIEQIARSAGAHGATVYACLRDLRAEYGVGTNAEVREILRGQPLARLTAAGGTEGPLPAKAGARRGRRRGA
jgi:DNA-binding CsgD family transcriptional regulator